MPEDFWAPLIIAAANGLTDVVRRLLEKGARPGYRDPLGKRARDYARENGHREVEEMIGDEDA